VLPVHAARSEKTFVAPHFGRTTHHGNGGRAVCGEVNCELFKLVCHNHAASTQAGRKTAKQAFSGTTRGQAGRNAASGVLLTSSLSVFVCLQAVETNLASKDSHWVFVNEVRCNTFTEQTRQVHHVCVMVQVQLHETQIPLRISMLVLKYIQRLKSSRKLLFRMLWAEKNFHILELIEKTLVLKLIQGYI